MAFVFGAAVVDCSGAIDGQPGFAAAVATFKSGVEVVTVTATVRDNRVAWCAT